VLPAGREAPGWRDPAPRAADPRDPGRASEALLAPGVAGHVGDRPRGGNAVLVRLPRARADPGLLRGVLRRASDFELHADRRPAVRPDTGLDGAALRVRPRSALAHRRLRAAPDGQPHLEESDG